MMNILRKKEAEANEAEAKEAEAKEAETQETEAEKKKKKETDETLRTLDIYGVKSFMEAKSRSARIFWLVLLILCTAAFIQQLYKTISNYINSPIVSTYTITTVPAMDFPIVYICPTAFISSLYLNKTPSAEKDAISLKEEMGVLWDYTDFLATGNLTAPSPKLPDDPLAHVDPSALKTMRPKTRRYNQTGPLLENDQNAEEFFKKATVELDWHNRQCEFREFMFEQFPTCRNITKEVLDPDYGKCYVVDVNPRQQYVQSQALVLYFNVQSRWYPKSPALTPLFNGVRLSIMRNYSVDRSGESIILAPGSYYRIDLSAQHQVFDSFQHPYPQKCVKSKAYPKFEIYNASYTQKSCQYDCAARAIKKACNCLPPIDSRVYMDGVLNTTDGFCKVKHIECIRSLSQSDSIRKDLQSCRDQCVRPCEDWRYAMRSTALDLYQYGLPGAPIQDLMILLVSFSQMEYTEFKQDSSKTPDQMIADIGGEAGLWIGAGMLTLIQMPLFFATMCGGCCKKNAKKLKAKRKGDGESGNAKE